MHNCISNAIFNLNYNKKQTGGCALGCSPKRTVPALLIIAGSLCGAPNGRWCRSAGNLHMHEICIEGVLLDHFKRFQSFSPTKKP